jgi:hypothetical protein
LIIELAADALYRVGLHFNAISAIVPVWVQDVINSYHSDAQSTTLLEELAVIQQNDQGYSLSDGVIKFKGRIWIANNSTLQTKLISSFHGLAIGGHSRIQATYQRLKKMFYWQGMQQDVQSFVQQCEICQKFKHELCKYPGLLQPLPIPQSSWIDISMDLIDTTKKITYCHDSHCNRRNFVATGRSYCHHFYNLLRYIDDIVSCSNRSSLITAKE